MTLASPEPGSLRDELRRQAALIGAASPAYGKLLATLDTVLAENGVLPFTDAWRDRVFSAWYDRPLLLLAALRFDAADPEHPLHGALWPERVPSTAKARSPGADWIGHDRVVAALDRPGLGHSLRTRSVQTNEVSRAVAWLWPATRLSPAETGGLVLVDLGCSAGLNLVADRLDLRWPGVTIRAPRVLARLGYDLKPGDVADDDAMAWLRACVWPGQAERSARLDRAIAAARAARARGELHLHASSLVDVPARIDADVERATRQAVANPAGTGGPASSHVLAYQTLVRDYLSPADRLAYGEGIYRWLADRRGAASWVELEHDPEGSPCAIIVHRWEPGPAEVVRRVIGICSHHPDAITPVGPRS